MAGETTFGYLLKQRRKALDLTREELANRVGCAVETLRKIETNARRPSRQLAERLAEILDVAPAERAAFMHVVRTPSRVSVPDNTPSLQAPALRPPALPRPLTSLIGREREITVVSTLLRRNDLQLVTITGSGGVGKTRLALQAAVALQEAFPDGVFFVPLAAITNPELVPVTIAQSVGMIEMGRQSLREYLNAYLRKKHCLLVLDNFEHLLDAAPFIAELLAAAPQLKVLVTSRAVLHLHGEQEFVVAPLSLPDAMCPLSAEVVSQSAAVELFIARAQNVRPDFALTNEIAPTVAEICVRLDGLPLAIELAAARVKLFAPAALLARLGNALSLLTGGARNVPIRQQTIRNTLDWSYRLLGDAEQTLFARLGVFVGSWTLEAAEAVCGDGPSTTHDGLATRETESIVDRRLSIVDGIAALLDHSLLRQSDGPDSEPCFTMLETIHEYARERLEISGEQEVMKRLHAEYFLKLAEQAEPELRKARGAEWVDWIEQAYDNVRAAIEWSFAGTDTRQSGTQVLNTAEHHRSAYADQAASPTSIQIGVRLVGSMGRFWDMRGRMSEARRWLAIALAHAPLSTPEQIDAHAKLLTIAGRFAFREGASAMACSLLEQSLTLYRSRTQRSGIAEVLYTLSIVMQQQQRYDVTQSLAEESLELYRELDDRQGIAEVSLMLGLCAWAQGAYVRATPLLEESLAVSRQLGNMRGIAGALNSLGLVALFEGVYASAKTLLEESLSVSRELGDGGGVVESLLNLGHVALNQGRYGEATRLLEESVMAAQSLSDQVLIAWSLRSLGTATWLQGDGEQALALYQASLPLYRDIDDKWGIAECLEGLAEVISAQSAVEGTTLSQAKQQYLPKAARFLAAAAALRETTGNPMAVGDRVIYERTLSVLRAALGKAAFTVAWEAGRTLSLEQVIAEALRAAE